MRRCKKYGPLILFLGIGILLAMLLPSSFYLFMAGAALIFLGVIISRK